MKYAKLKSTDIDNSGRYHLANKYFHIIDDMKY